MTILSMATPDRPGRDYLSGEDGRAALRSLTVVERLLCQRLIARQFAYSAKIPSLVDDSGPEAAVRLCSARALQVYLLLIGVTGAAFATAGLAAVAVPAFALVVLLAAVIMGRLVSATRSGRRWRDGRR